MSNNHKESILSALQYGNLSLQGEFVWGSNYTFLLDVQSTDTILKAVYKPTRGTRPLWDFPADSLPRREVAAYVVSEALKWNMVPPTVFREDGPLGPGSVQLYIEHDPEYHYFNFSKADIQKLRPVVLYDLLINNADRKGSHIIIDQEGKMWLIDHGVCFHIENKLRSVIWDFAGEAISEELCENMREFKENLQPISDAQNNTPSDLVKKLRPHLSTDEITALANRADQIIRYGYYPNPRPNRRPYPWPPV